MISFLFRETFDESSEPLQYKTRKSDHSNMLSSSEASLSPKAKVSYDDGEFAVEIPLRDYKVIFKFNLMLISFLNKVAHLVCELAKI